LSQHDQRVDVTALSVDYAIAAAEVGWSNETLRAFLDARGISALMQKSLWPDGARSAGRALNAYADAAMVRRHASGPSASLVEIMTQRFADNRSFKRSVRRLAQLDLVHPGDTLSRTARTAEQMIACRGGYRTQGGLGHWLELWLLVLGYSACVLVWLADRTPDDRRTRAVVGLLFGGSA
jgi:hypothetical protein